ncbi:MAG TPA: cysteine desulfurase family protein [Candidatus Nanoarchaeia archaeon]|nr:cysteine desulfurase family protein [Candidatus Nanoarchaeia archaeon]
MTIYLDNAATTAMDIAVVKVMQPFFSEKYGNPSSTHSLGREAREAVNKARASIAAALGARPQEVIFLGSGTEANNLAIKGAALALKSKGNHIITSSIEHDSVLEACKWLETQGFSVTYLPVDNDGKVSMAALEKAFTPKTILVTIMHANNEIGTVQDIQSIAAECAKRKVLFHTDASQSFTKIPIDFGKQQLSMVTVSSHKIHGPKGIAALVVREGVKLMPLMHGGGHERGVRSGTENVPGIVGFEEAARQAKQEHVSKMEELRDNLISGLERMKGVILNGPKGGERLCNNVNVWFEGIEAESLLVLLDKAGICASTGSACSSKELEPSHVLRAIGLTPVQAHGSVRFSLSRFTTQQEIEEVLRVIPGMVERLRGKRGCSGRMRLH